jgi:hypothetical protein
MLSECVAERARRAGETSRSCARFVQLRSALESNRELEERVGKHDEDIRCDYRGDPAIDRSGEKAAA